MDASGDIVTKLTFSQMVKRDPAFVSRAIGSGKLHGEALVGTGRSARIRVSAALRQLGESLDVGQQLAQSVPILTDEAPADLLDLPAAGSDTAPASPLAKAASAEHLALKNQKLRLELERLQIADAIRDGQLVDVAQISIAVRRQLAPLVAIFDEVGPAIARKVAEQHGLDYPAVLITVNAAMRAQRQAYSERAMQIGVPAPAEAAAA